MAKDWSISSFLLSRKFRSAAAFLGWCIALEVPLITGTPHPWIAALIILTGIVWVLILFTPELRKLKMVYGTDDSLPHESAAWLVIFSFAALGAVILAGIVVWRSMEYQPRQLTADEFAEPYIHGKHFHLMDLVAQSGSSIIEKRTIEDSWIYGPAVVLLTGSGLLHDSTFEVRKSPDELFLEVPAGTFVPFTGVIVVQDSVFRRCYFRDIMFIATPETIKDWKEKNHWVESPMIEKQ